MNQVAAFKLCRVAFSLSQPSPQKSHDKLYFRRRVLQR